LGRFKLAAFFILLDGTARTSQEEGAQITTALGKLVRGGGDEVHFNDELVSFTHVLPDRQYAEPNTGIAIVSTLLTLGQRAITVGAMRRRMKDPAPEGFVIRLRELMVERKISLNQLAQRAGISPAFLSRILNQERSLPSDKTITKLAEILRVEPSEQLLFRAGRIPEELKPTLSRPLTPILLRATGNLSETDMQEVLEVAQKLALKQRRKRKPNESGR
jgi:transcriptional regulator with XRE-family HTH domain